MLKLNKKEKILIIGLGVLILCYFLEKTIMGTFSGKVEMIDVQIKAKEEKYERFLYIDSSKKLILDVYNRVKPYLETDKSESDLVSVVMKQIEEMAKENRINLLKMRPETYDASSDERFKTKKITLTIEGSQKNIVKLFYELENNKHPMSINKMDLRIKNRDMNLMTAEIDILFMYYA